LPPTDPAKAKSASGHHASTASLWEKHLLVVESKKSTFHFSIRPWASQVEAAVAVELHDPRSIKSALAVLSALVNWFHCHPNSEGLLSAPWQYLQNDAGVSRATLHRRIQDFHRWGLLDTDESGSTEQTRPLWDTRKGNLTATYRLLITATESSETPHKPLRELLTETPPTPQDSTEDPALRAGGEQLAKSPNRVRVNRPARRPDDPAEIVRQCVPWLRKVRLSAIRRVIGDKVSWGYSGQEIADRVLAAGVQEIDGVDVVLTDYPTAPVGLLASRLKSVAFAALDDAEVARLSALARVQLDEVQVLNDDAERRPKTYAERAREVVDPCPDGDPLGAVGCAFCRRGLPHPGSE
jgi:hypothetical protein